MGLRWSGGVLRRIDELGFFIMAGSASTNGMLFASATWLVLVGATRDGSDLTAVSCLSWKPLEGLVTFLTSIERTKLRRRFRR